jgi:imidazolonepropionase-like amidohydrolase
MEDTIAIQNGKVVTVTGRTFENGKVLVKQGKIIAVGDKVDIPGEAILIDAKGGWITPGLIDCHTHLSVMPALDTMPSFDDTNEMSDPITPHVRALDALNPFDEAIEVVRSAGFTTCYTGPGSANIVGGTGCSFKLRGHTAEEMFISGSEQMKFALGENPKRCYGLNGKLPITRMGTAGLLRETLSRAVDYSNRLIASTGKKANMPNYDSKSHALLKVIRGEQRCRIHCHRADDIITAIRIAKEFGLDFTIEHATEGYLVADVLKKENVTCIIGPLLLSPLKRELWGLRQDTPAKMEKAGVTICLTADGATDTQFLPTHVGIIMRKGLSEATAFAALTINPARVMQLEDRIGSLEPGKDADIAIFNGHPFSNMTDCVLTMIDGEIYNSCL